MLPRMWPLRVSSGRMRSQPVGTAILEGPPSVLMVRRECLQVFATSVSREKDPGCPQHTGSTVDLPLQEVALRPVEELPTPRASDQDLRDRLDGRQEDLEVARQEETPAEEDQEDHHSHRMEVVEVVEEAEEDPPDHPADLQGLQGDLPDRRRRVHPEEEASRPGLRDTQEEEEEEGLHHRLRLEEEEVRSNTRWGSHMRLRGPRRAPGDLDGSELRPKRLVLRSCGFPIGAILRPGVG